jgi:hypothetical protein
MNPLIRRREPRVLALSSRDDSIAYVVVDLIEFRSSGEEPTTPRTKRLHLRRLVLRERPTAIVSDTSAPTLARSNRDRVPRVPKPHRLLPFRAVAAAYPEARVFAPTERLERLARIAVTSLARGAFPSRRYANHPRR